MSVILGLCLLLSIQNVWCEVSDDCIKCGEAKSFLDVANEMIVKAKDSFTCPSSRSVYRPSDCTDVLNDGHKMSGIYTIWPVNRLLGNSSINVYCDMDTDGGGWTVIQRRGNFNRSADYFFKEWNSYKKGFGDLSKDFWLGNDNIFALTNQRLYSIRFDLRDLDGNKAYALYDEFWIADEKNKYRLNVQDYSGTAGDSLEVHNNQFFTTKDQKNDQQVGQNCATQYQGAWWYNNCYDSNLNGNYLPSGIRDVASGQGMYWKAWKGPREVIESAEMKIRPKNFK